ncbi:MAG: HAMP domain-containing protein, partial [Litorivicinus sp.]
MVVGAKIIAQGFVNAEDLIGLSASQVRLASSVGSAADMLEAAGASNPNVAAAMAGRIDALRAAGAAIDASLLSLMNSSTVSLSQSEWAGQITALNDAMVESSADAGALLAGLLKARIDGQVAVTTSVMTAVAISVVLAIALSFLLFRRINRGLGDALGHFGHIQNGDLTQAITVKGKDELGQLASGLKTMQGGLSNRAQSDALVLAENTRVKQSLDFVSTPVMIVDNDGQIIYANGATESLMQASEANLRSALPGFDAAKLIGTGFDQFQLHQFPVTQLSGERKADVSIGEQHFVLTANPVTCPDRNPLGCVIEWNDVTAERAIEREIGTMVVNAANGELSSRIDLAGKKGFYKTLGEGLNSMADSAGTIISETAEVLGAMSTGDLTVSIEGEYRGRFGELKDSVNQTIAQITSVMERILNSSEQIRSGAEEIAQGNSDLSHRTEEQASSLEETA